MQPIDLAKIYTPIRGSSILKTVSFSCPHLMDKFNSDATRFNVEYCGAYGTRFRLAIASGRLPGYDARSFLIVDPPHTYLITQLGGDPSLPLLESPVPNYTSTQIRHAFFKPLRFYCHCLGRSYHGQSRTYCVRDMPNWYVAPARFQSKSSMAT